MKIGQLARRTGVAPRLLRYYEQQGLITAERSGNGYRNYTDEDVAHVQRVAGLVRAGFPTRVVRTILHIEGIRSAELAATCTRDLAEELATELAEIDERIACLSRSRESIHTFLCQTEHGALAIRAGGSGSPDAQGGTVLPPR